MDLNANKPKLLVEEFETKYIFHKMLKVDTK